MKNLLDPFGEDRNELDVIFKEIAQGNSILFLGAGASVTNNQYLSKQIIDYYEDKIGRNLGISNITEFIDVASENDWFSRSEFDGYVFELLNRLKINETHKTILTIPWREIITTNFDLLLEQADQETVGKSDRLYELVKVRNISEFRYFCDKTQVKYIKLNGCMSDRSAYPFRFSTDDFKVVNKFYKNVLEELKSVSDKIRFLSIGYSFSDSFAEALLERFDKYNYREKRLLWNVDPNPNEYKLPYYNKKRILTIKCSAQDFFSEYRKWEEANIKLKLRAHKGGVYTNSTNSTVQLGYKLALQLKGVVDQLNDKYSGKFITESDFYRGEEPSYQVITKGYDILKRKKIDQVRKKLNQILQQNSTLIPIIFLTGNFGTGKTTFNYRIIYELIHAEGNDATAFEIVDIDNLRREAFKELIEIVRSKQVIIYCNDVEVDSVFKALIELRTYLSSVQLSELKIFFLLSIRENILEKIKQTRPLKAAYEINVDSGFRKEEISELVDRLKANGLINFRDIHEREAFVNKIERKYKGDSFIALLDLVNNGKHINDLRDAYMQLSKHCQEAFIYTALVHRFNLLIPASVLKDIVSRDWEEFRATVINVEGKGILIQEDSESRGLDPDLYFRTKHSLIAEKLVQEIIPSKEKRFQYYQKIIQKLTAGYKTSKFVCNLLKVLRISSEMPQTRINQLYDLAYKNFQDDPYFLLRYSINLEHRREREDLERAIEELQYAESLLPFRNDRFIHRRGVLNFKLAQLYYKEERALNLTIKYLDEARDLLFLKQQLDPSSSWSYYHLLELLIWEIQSIEYDPEEEVRKRVLIEDLFENAKNAVSDDIGGIFELKQRYSDSFQSGRDYKEYKKSLDEMYLSVELRPYACILLFNYYQNQRKNPEKQKEYVNEMELYTENDEVSKFLFKYYGRMLNHPSILTKFFKLSQKIEWYEEYNPLRYNYYNYVAEAYNHQPHLATKYLQRINAKFNTLNPEFALTWLEVDSETPRIFEGSIVLSKRGFKVFRSKELQKEFRFVMTSLDEYKVGDVVRVNLKFYLAGIRAILIHERKGDNEAAKTS